MRHVLDTLLDITEMERCLQQEREVSHAKDFFVNLFEQAYIRVDADLNGEANVIRLLVPDRDEFVLALKTHAQLRLS